MKGGDFPWKTNHFQWVATWGCDEIYPAISRNNTGAVFLYMISWKEVNNDVFQSVPVFLSIHDLAWHHIPSIIWNHIIFKKANKFANMLLVELGCDHFTMNTDDWSCWNSVLFVICCKKKHLRRRDHDHEVYMYVCIFYWGFQVWRTESHTYTDPWKKQDRYIIIGISHF